MLSVKPPRTLSPCGLLVLSIFSEKAWLSPVEPPGEVKFTFSVYLECRLSGVRFEFVEELNQVRVPRTVSFDGVDVLTVVYPAVSLLGVLNGVLEVAAPIQLTVGNCGYAAPVYVAPRPYAYGYGRRYYRGPYYGMAPTAAGNAEPLFMGKACC